MSGVPQPTVVFLDRDGTIIEDRHYVGRASDVRLIPGAARAIRGLNRRGVPVVVVTNQSGIGRGLFSESDYVTVQDEVERQLAEEGGRLNAVYHCPHDPTRTKCGCRKPELALYERASRELGDADLERAAWVGDSVGDVIPAERLGGQGFLIRTAKTPRESMEPIPATVRIVRDLAEAVSLMLGEPRASMSCRDGSGSGE